jgi:hypothetical protein
MEMERKSAWKERARLDDDPNVAEACLPRPRQDSKACVQTRESRNRQRSTGHSLPPECLP